MKPDRVLLFLVFGCNELGPALRPNLSSDQVSEAGAIKVYFLFHAQRLELVCVVEVDLNHMCDCLANFVDRTDVPNRIDERGYIENVFEILRV